MKKTLSKKQSGGSAIKRSSLKPDLEQALDRKIYQQYMMDSSKRRTRQFGGPAESTPKRETLPKKQYAVNTGAGTVPASKVKTPSNKTIRKIDKSLKPVVQKSRSTSVKSPAPKRRKF